MAMSSGRNSIPETSKNKQVFALASSLLVALMMACFMITVFQFLRRINVGWQVTYLPWLGFLMSLEAIYTTYLSRKLSYSSEDWLKMRLAELVVILVIMKLLLYTIYSPISTWFDIQTWRNFFIEFFNESYLMAIGVTIFLWVIASQFGEDLYNVGREDYAKRQEIAYYISEDRALARRRLVDRILVLGAIMIAITAVVSMDLQLIWGDRPLINMPYLNLLLYFVLGFALFSLTQFALLGASWRYEDTPVQRNVASRWVITSLIFLLVLAGLVWFLPTRYSLGLLSALSLLFSSLISIVMFLWKLFGFLLASFFHLLGFFEDQDQPPLENLIPPNLQLPPVVPGEPSPWIEVLKSILFWSVLIGVIGFAIYQYLQQNQELWQKIRFFPLVSWLVSFFNWLGRRIIQARGSIKLVVGAVRSRLTPVRTAGKSPEAWRFIRVHNLPPRQQVLFFFMALVRKAEHRGIRRGNAQTPHEFAQALEASLPEVESNLEPFTDTFVEARYSLHLVTDEQASQAHRWWQSLRKVILRRKPAQ